MARRSYSYAMGQVAWFMHDLGHFSVFRTSRMNRIFHYLVMSVYLGGSARYWRNAHWKHHLFTNIEGWDHDVDTLPFFAWTKDMLKRAPVQAIAKYQPYYWYFAGPALSFVYISFLSMQFMISRRYYLEILGNVACFSFLYYMLELDPLTFLYFRLCTLVFLGSYMGHIFSLNHFPMPIADKASNSDPIPSPAKLKDLMGNFVEHQMKSSRDIESNWWNDYFTGHLNYQIEHHLWPTMPRYNLWRVKDRVKAMCKKHNLHYEEVGFVRAFYDVFSSLREPCRVKDD